MSKNKATQQTSRQDGWLGYVNWNPIASDRDKVAAFMGEPSFDGWEYVLQLDESGYSCTFSYDEANSCHRLSVTGKGQHCPNKGYTLSLRASSPIRCLALASYYVYVICQSGDWLVDKKGDELW